jgi:hypothetical protein
MIDEFDLDQDGEINEQEFFAIMMDDAWATSLYQPLPYSRIIGRLYASLLTISCPLSC